MKKMVICFGVGVVSAILLGLFSLLPMGFAIPLMVVFGACGAFSIVRALELFSDWID